MRRPNEGVRIALHTLDLDIGPVRGLDLDRSDLFREETVAVVDLAGLHVVAGRRAARDKREFALQGPKFGQHPRGAVEGGFGPLADRESFTGYREG